MQSSAVHHPRSSSRGVDSTNVGIGSNHLLGLEWQVLLLVQKLRRQRLAKRSKALLLVQRS